MKKKIRAWKCLTNEITDVWIREYFDIPNEKEETYFDWVQIGEVFNFGDYWFSFSTVLECYELGVTKKQLFEWYDKSLSQEIDLPLSQFILSPKKLKEQQEKHLEELKLRVEWVEKEFKQALEEYER